MYHPISMKCDFENGHMSKDQILQIQDGRRRNTENRFRPISNLSINANDGIRKQKYTGKQLRDLNGKFSKFKMVEFAIFKNHLKSAYRLMKGRGWLTDVSANGR